MPSDNLGVGVFSGSIAAKSAVQSDTIESALVAGTRSASRGMNWLVAAGALMVGDVAVACAAVYVALLGGVIPEGARIAALLGVPVLVLMAFLGRGLYAAAKQGRRDFSAYAVVAGWIQAVALFLLIGLVVVPGVVGLFSAPGEVQFPQALSLHEIASAPMLFTPALLGSFAVGLLGLLAWRFGWRMVGPTIARPVLDRVVIVGDSVESARLLPRLREQPGVSVVGLIEPFSGDERPPADRMIDNIPIVAGLEELGVMVRGGLVDTALVAPGRLDDGSTLRRVLEQARISTLDVKVMPQVATALAGGTLPSSLSTIGEMPVIELQRRPLSARALLIKRIEDVVLGTLMLIALSPIMALVALAIRLDTKGPIFFRQPRVGLNGNVFEMFKFRSMHHHAVDPGAVRQTQRGDPRVTRVGAVLRRHSLDELPQILNVLRGDMSIVGPRPHALAMTAQGMALEEAAKDYPARFRMKPGITGWAQTNGWRGNVDTVEKLVRRVEHDLFYIEHWSLGLDLLILRKTVSCVFSDETAY